jgi:hypothetical protein
MNPETKIEIKACGYVWQYLGIKGGKLTIIGDVGYPDRIFWLPGGKPLLIEFKQPGHVPNPTQQEVHTTLRSLGYNVQVHTNAIDAFEAVINAVETPRLSKKVSEVLARARSRCVVLRSGIR